MRTSSAWRGRRGFGLAMMEYYKVEMMMVGLNTLPTLLQKPNGKRVQKYVRKPYEKIGLLKIALLR